jgi:glycosyltransferase involved in cell wall biosynthesis
MKVLIPTGIFPPDIGGPATYSETLAEQFNQRGIKTDVICYADREIKDNYPFAVFRILRKYPIWLRYFLYFFQILKIGRRYEIIYAQDPICAGLPAVLAARILRKKFILKITGDYAWEQGRQRFGVKDLLDDFLKKRYSWRVELMRLIEKKVAQAAIRIIVPSQYLKKVVQQWGVREEKIEVVYNAIEKLPDLEISQEEAQKRIGIKGDILLSVGRLVPWKGFDALIEIMPDLLKENPEFRLVIIGRGPEKKHLESKIGNLGLKDQVFLIDQVKHSQLPFYFRAAGLFILNTAYEGLPHIILEAIQMKVPVITTNIGGNPEVIKNNHNGILVRYNDKQQLKEAVWQLWKDKDLQEKYIKNAYQDLGKFSLEQMINHTLRVLKT